MKTIVKMTNDNNDNDKSHIFCILVNVKFNVIYIINKIIKYIKKTTNNKQTNSSYLWVGE